MKKLLLVSSILAALLPGVGISQTNSQLDQAKAIETYSTMALIRGVSVSDDGKKLAMIRATSKNGDYVIEVRDTSKLDAQPVILGADKMLVSGVTWLSSEKLLVQFRQLLKSGPRKYWVQKIAIVAADGTGSWLVPFKDKPYAGFEVINLLHDSPDEILVAADLDGKRMPNVVRFNIHTGRSTTVLRSNDKIQGNFIADHQGEVRAASGFNSAEGSIDQYARVKGSDDWKLIRRISPKSRESYEFIAFSKENPNEVYINANIGEDKTGIYLYNLETEKYSDRLFGLESVDTDGLVFNRKGDLLGIRYTDKWPTRYMTNESEHNLDLALAPLFPNKNINVVSRSLDDNVLIIRSESPKDPGSYYMLTGKQKLVKIGAQHPALTEDLLADVKYISYTARDGKKIYAYVTLPQGKAPFPAVVMPHGGPWVRDTIMFDEWAQLLASQGYAVIQPNYRGSTGYGLEHWVAGDQNWGLKMQDDLDDAAMYLVNAGLATKQKLAMFGWSYGGYAAFAASMRDNNIYQCTVAGAGVSDLARINAGLNENPFSAKLQRPTIKGVNPLSQVEKVNVPILVIHGDIDVRVPVSHSRDFVEKLVELKKDHKYVELKDADHFSDTLFTDHKQQFYGELLNWLGNKCGLKK